MADLATLFCHSIVTDLRRELEEDLMHLWHEAVVRATATSYSFEQAGADFRRWLLFHVVRVVIAGASVPPASS